MLDVNELVAVCGEGLTVGQVRGRGLGWGLLEPSQR